ncbi:MAG: glycosyltransferase, partial [Acidobacteriota bacterium]
MLTLSSYLPVIGGGELQTHAMARALATARVQVRVVDTRGAPGPPLCERIDRIPVLRYRTPGLRGIDFLVQQVKLAALLGRWRDRTDIIQVNHLGPAIMPALAMARTSGIPLLVLMWGSCRRGVGPFRRSPYCRLLRMLARRADRVLALSQPVAGNLVRLWGFPPHKVQVIPNGVDTRRFRPHLGASRPQGAPRTGAIVVAIGRLTAAKRYDLLLEAWSEVCRDGPETATLVFIGAGGQREALERKARRAGIRSRVLFAGAVAEVERWLSVASLFVSSSTTEGMSNAVLEAMSCGVPIVATRVG